MTIISGYALSIIFSASKTDTNNLADKWILSGLLIYYAVTIPYISAFELLSANIDNDTFKNLHKKIIPVAANIRYFCLAVGFYVIIKQHKTTLF